MSRTSSFDALLRRLSRLLLIAGSVMYFSSASAVPPPGYYLVWSDEFNSTSLDRAKWDYWLSGHRRNAVNVANAISLNGSNLVITTYTSNKVHYTGFVASDETFRPRYGYWESSIRWSDTNGMWSAFWLQSPEMVTRSPDPKLFGTEIDIAEHRFLDKDGGNIANKIQVNLHWNGYGPSSHSSGSGNVGSGLADGFHTYGFLWTPDSYTFLTDGSRVYGHGSAPISHSGAWVIFSSEVDDTSTLWAGHIPTEGYGGFADSTTRMDVDYVRYYAPSNILYWTGADSSHWTNSANWIAGRMPETDSDVTLSYLTTNPKSVLNRDYTVRGLVLLQTKQNVSIEGTHAISIGSGGIDMSDANHYLGIDARVNVSAPQTWMVGQKSSLSLDGGVVCEKEAVTKAGNGLLILNATNDFSGGLNIDAGTLMVTGTLAANPLSIRGRLRGEGFIEGRAIIESNGVVSPGNLIGTLNFLGSLTLSSNSIISLEVNKSLRRSDRLRIAGPINYRGNLVVTNLDGELAAGDRFRVFEAKSYEGAFNHLQLPPLPPELEWNTGDLTNGFLSVIAATHKQQ